MYSKWELVIPRSRCDKQEKVPTNTRSALSFHWKISFFNVPIQTDGNRIVADTRNSNTHSSSTY